MLSRLLILQRRTRRGSCALQDRVPTTDGSQVSAAHLPWASLSFCPSHSCLSFLGPHKVCCLGDSGLDFLCHNQYRTLPAGCLGRLQTWECTTQASMLATTQGSSPGLLHPAGQTTYLLRAFSCLGQPAAHSLRAPAYGFPAPQRTPGSPLHSAQFFNQEKLN